MNNNAKLWVKALKSGKYKQTSGTLQDEDGYCCLGVACKLYEKKTGKKLEKNDRGFYCDATLRGKFTKVRKWLRLHFSDGEYGCNDNLTDLNDSGYSFKEIAKIIESEPKGLFIKEKL